MAWDDIARQDHRRVCARYPSDMTDREWAIIAPLLPPARAGGRPRTVDLRAVMDAILFIASSGCQWRMLPKVFPPRSTGQGGRCRRLAKDWEKTIESSSAWALVASIRLLSRRLARYCYQTYTFESGTQRGSLQLGRKSEPLPHQSRP